MLNEPGNFVYELAIPVRWYDMDAFGHVNSSVYFTYFEQTRISWWNEVAPTKLQLLETGPVVVSCHCNFRRSIIFPENILVKLYVSSPSRSSYDTFYRVVSQTDVTLLYADGAAKIVWVDRKLGRAIPLPDELRHLLPEK